MNLNKKYTQSVELLPESSILAQPNMEDSSSLVGEPEHLMQYIGSFCATLGALNLGITLGYASPTSPMLDNSTDAGCALPHDQPLDEGQLAVYSSIVNVGAMLGVVLGGVSVKYLGRRGTMMLCSVPFAIAWGLIGEYNIT